MKKALFVSIVCTLVILLAGFVAEEPTVLGSMFSEGSIENEEALNGLVFIPSSKDYPDTSCGNHRNFGFELKNNGGVSASGQVQVSTTWNAFSCVSGCSFSLSPSQSQYVHIRFAPEYEGPASATVYAGNASASVSGTGTEPSPDPENPDCMSQD